MELKSPGLVVIAQLSVTVTPAAAVTATGVTERPDVFTGTQAVALVDHTVTSACAVDE
jgi:hypothetical protein